MADRPFNVLFLCTGNSARSILAEAIASERGAPHRVVAWSAGSRPTGTPHPDALAELERRGHRSDLWRSKSWDEFSGEGAPEIDLVVTVCDSAANEACPVFPGRGLRVHWPAPDPAYIEDDDTRTAAFADVYDLMRRRIEDWLALPRGAWSDSDRLQALA